MRVLSVLLSACLSVAATVAPADPYTIFLLDVSGSMEYPVAQEKRLDRAKAAIVDTLSSSDYADAELILWNSRKLGGEYGTPAEIASQVRAAPRGHEASYLGSALMSISDAGHRCSHVVFVTDEYPDDQRNFSQAVERLLADGRQNTVTVYVVKHPGSKFFAGRFAQVTDSAHYRVVDGDRQSSLAGYLKAHPAADSCGALS